MSPQPIIYIFRPHARSTWRGVRAHAQASLDHRSSTDRMAARSTVRVPSLMRVGLMFVALDVDAWRAA